MQFYAKILYIENGWGQTPVLVRFAFASYTLVSRNSLVRCPFARWNHQVTRERTLNYSNS